MITISRTMDSRKNQRAFGGLNVVDEIGVVEKVLAAHESAKAGGLVCTVYVVLESRAFARTRVTGLTNDVVRQLSTLKPGQKIRLNGQTQMRGYIVAASVNLAEQNGIEQLS
jgi:hypothetical protein